MQQERTGISIGSLVCGIVSTALSALAIPIGIFLSWGGWLITIAGLITGIIAIALGVKGKQALHAGRAIAGFVLGIIGTSLHGVLFFGFLLLHFFYS